MMLALQNRKIYNWSLAGIQARVVIKQLFSNLCHPKYKENTKRDQQTRRIRHIIDSIYQIVQLVTE